jgi:hypothetical protein
VWIGTEYSEWRPVRGVLYAHRTVERELETGKVLAQTTIRAIRLNTSPPADRFELP